MAAVKEALASGPPEAVQQREQQPGAGDPTVPAEPTDQAPMCPRCGVPMVLRTARKGGHKGADFYGCPNYPRCRETRPAPAGNAEPEGGAQ